MHRWGSGVWEEGCGEDALRYQGAGIAIVMPAPKISDDTRPTFPIPCILHPDARTWRLAARSSQPGPRTPDPDPDPGPGTRIMSYAGSSTLNTASA
jgi:hypothetical protein